MDCVKCGSTVHFLFTHPFILIFLHYNSSKSCDKNGGQEDRCVKKMWTQSCLHADSQRRDESWTIKQNVWSKKYFSKWSAQKRCREGNRSFCPEMCPRWETNKRSGDIRSQFDDKTSSRCRITFPDCTVMYTLIWKTNKTQYTRGICRPSPDSDTVGQLMTLDCVQLLRMTRVMFQMVWCAAHKSD